MIAAKIIPQARFTAGFTTREDDIRSDPATRGFKGRVLRLRQVHSARLVRVRAGDDAEAVATIEADGLVTGVPGVLLTVRTADCVPVLLAGRRGRAIAAVHAGRRGLVQKIVPAAIDEMKAACGVRPEDILAAIGPCIGSCCYEVGQDVAGSLAGACGDPSVVTTRDGKAFASLPSVARAQLIASGIPSGAIEIVALCTLCRRDLFFSRRGGASPGERQCGYIGINP